jgi:hypothetical protein
MNTTNRLALFLTLAAAVFAAACGNSGSVATPPPPVGGFTNASLKGQYVFSMSGSDTATGDFFARIGVFVADGQGGISSGVEDVNTPGGGQQTIAYTASTYSIQKDGRGTINLTNSTGTLSFSVTLLSDSQGLIVQTDLSLVGTASGSFYLQNPNSLTTGLSGNYVFDFSGVDAISGGGPDSIIGQLVAPGGLTGTFSSGLIDENDSGSLLSAAPFTGSNFQTDATYGPTFGRGTLSFIANGITFSYAYYIVDGTRARMIEVNSNALTIGDAISQSSVPSSNANFNGSFAFLASGSGSSGGNIFADTNDAFTVASVPHGSLSATTYAIDTVNAGTGRGTLTFTDSKLGTYSFVFYLSSSSGGVIQDVSANQVADGTLALQTGAPFSNASLAGDYGLNFSGVSQNSTTNASGEEDYVGHINLTSATSNNVTGVVDYTEFSSNQGLFTNVVVSGTGLNIGGDGTTSNGTRNSLTLTLSGNPSSTLHFVAYLVNSQTIYVAGTDNNRVLSGIINVQNP